MLAMHATFKLNERIFADIMTRMATLMRKLLAAQSCPTMADAVNNIETGEKIWPK